ncbi:hypothetical protein V3C99_015270, partial [Haemonchus contortus]
EHRFVRKPNKPSFDHLRCLGTNIELRRRGVPCGSGEALQRRPHFLRGHCR